MKDNNITSNYDESYKELKTSLKEKYTRILCTAIDEAREVVIKRSSEILSKEYLSMLSETESLKKTVKEQETEFFNSEKYVTAQKSLTILKDKLATCLDSEKESVQKDLSKLLEQITTMNITIKNRLKVYTDKIKENEKILKNIEYLKKSNKDFVFRVPLIPNITDTDENLAAIAEIAGENRVELLPYNSMAGAKYDMVGLKYCLECETEDKRKNYTEFFANAIIR